MANLSSNFSTSTLVLFFFAIVIKVLVLKLVLRLAIGTEVQYQPQVLSGSTNVRESRDALTTTASTAANATTKLDDFFPGTLFDTVKEECGFTCALGT